MAKSALYNDRERVPPDDATRLLMFLDAADSYEDLARTYPLPTSFNIPHGVSREQYWILVLHAGMLRKFFAPSDQVTVGKTMQSVRQLVLVENPVMMQDFIEFEQYATARSVPMPVGLKVGAHDVMQWEVVEVELYGRHLHSDWSKWKASERIRHGSWNVHIGQWCRSASLMVKIATQKIRWYSEEGFIEFDAPPSPHSGDD